MTRLFMILYVNAHAIGSVTGPLIECRHRAAAMQQTIARGISDPKITDGDRRNLRLWRFVCEYRAQRPKMGEIVR